MCKQVITIVVMPEHVMETKGPMNCTAGTFAKASPVRHVNKSQDHMRLDFAVAEHNLQHQSLSLEKLAANISGRRD